MRGPGAGRRGLTMLEVLLSMAVFATVAGGASFALTRAVALGRTNRETAIALQAAESVLEEMRGVPFDEVFVRFNTTTGDEPSVGPKLPGAFAVPALRVRANDPDGLAGLVQFPGNGAQLVESWQDPGLGMPRDLNDDSDTFDVLTHPAPYSVLPVRVRVEWDSVGGPRDVELVAVLTYD